MLAERIGTSWIDACPEMTDDTWADLLRDGEASIEVAIDGRAFVFAHVNT